MPLLAALSPEMGSKGSFIHPEILNKASIYIIFITSGLSINTRYFIQTTKKLKLHLFVQIFCFVVIPIFMFGFHFFIFSKLSKL